MIRQTAQHVLGSILLLTAVSLLLTAFPLPAVTAPDKALPVPLVTPTPLPGSSLVSATIQSSGHNQDLEWTSGGPHGISITSLAVHPTDSTTIYAGSLAGIFRSTDSGNTWTTVLEDQDISALAIHPVFTDTVYAGGWESVFKSTDGGNTWETVSTGLPYGPSVRALAIDPNETGTVYAGTAAFGVYRSQNGGATWAVANTGLPSEIQVYALSIDPHAHGHVYAGTSSGVFKTATADISWTAVNTGLPITEYHAVAIDTENPNTVYVACYYNPYYAGVYNSTDGGMHWRLVRSGITGADVRGLVAVSSAVYIATDDGVFRSVDEGQRWRGLWPDRSSSLQIHTLAVSAEDPPILYLGAWSDTPEERGVWQTTLADPPPIMLLPTSPAKAVLIVGPIDAPKNDQTQAAIREMEQRAAQLEEIGLQVVRLYHPYATWPNIRENLSGATIVLYHGHGFGYHPDDVNYLDTGGGNNGFCITDPANLSGATLATQDMLVAYSQLAQDAIVMIFACYSAGSSASDPAVVSEAVARRRVNDYAYTFHAIGARAYYAGGNWRHYLDYMLSSLDRTAGLAYQTAPGYNASTLRAFQHNQYPAYELWLSPSVNSTGQVTAWWTAFAGDPSLTGRQALGYHLPRLSVRPTNVSFLLKPTDPDRNHRTIEIANGGGGSLNWKAILSDNTWLGISPSSGSAPGNLTLSVDKAGMAEGIYTGTVTISGQGPVYDSPQSVHVMLYIADLQQVYLPLVLHEEMK